MTERKRHGRKLLIASLGVAAVSYVACGGSTESDNGGSSNDAGVRGSGGTGGSGVGGSQTGGGPVGNLMPFPTDSGTGGYQGAGGAGTGGAGTGGDVQSDAGATDAPADTGPVIDWDVIANLVPPP